MNIERLESRRLFAAFVLDKGFGAAGLLDTRDSQIGEVIPSQTLIDAEGRVIVVTPFSVTPGGNRKLAIRRYHADGSVDKTFDGDGKLLIDIGTSKQPDPLVTLLKDNSVVVAMRQPTLPLLQRFDVKGRFDAAFTKNLSNYKRFTPQYQENRREVLYTDAQGRIVFMQYVTLAQFPLFGGTLIAPNEIIQARISRYNPSGIADTRFGNKGGLDLNQLVDSPQSYKVSGRVLNRRFDMNFAQPQIDANDNVIVAGSRGYARGSETGPANSFSSVILPFVYSFNSAGVVNRKMIAGLDPGKSTFVEQRLVYSGLATDITAAVLAPDGTLYTAGLRNGYFYNSGVAVFKSTSTDFECTGFDSTFITAQLQLYGNKVWALQSNRTGLITRLSAINPDATAGETIGLGRTFNDPRLGALNFGTINKDRPGRIIGFQDYQELDLRSLNLVEQSGTTEIVGSTVKVTGTAGEDFISITKRSDGRYVVTGAGVTRSFSKGIKKFEVDLAGGDDMFDTSYGLSVDLAVFGSAGSDRIWTSSGNDFLSGGSGDDSLVGDAGNDTVYGDSGNDSLEGNAGIDQLFGGSGTDWSFRLQNDTYDSIEQGI